MADNTITIYGTHWCADCRRSKRFLGERLVRYQWIDIEQDDAARQLVEKLNHGMHVVPTIVFPDGSVLAEPSDAQLAAKLGLDTRAKR